MKIRTLLAGLVSAALLAVGIVLPAEAATKRTYSQPINMSYVVVPHPDDEWQAWSLIENSPANYKVFISATEGEQSGYCDTPSSGSTPSPYPTGKWTTTCSQARFNSWLGFFSKMSSTDASIPGDWTVLADKGPFPANGYALKTDDGGTVANSDRQARVAIDKQGRGAAIMFDLGDGDLTKGEVQWAIETVKNNRAALGINTSLPNYNILGAFSHGGAYGSQCFEYDHPDHYNVHWSIYNVNYGMVGYQSAATCKGDGDVARTKIVSDNATNTAWGSGGAFVSNYGWLGNYQLSQDQSKLFMREQSFWQRY